MEKPKPITIPLEECERFTTFINTASQLKMSGHLRFAVEGRFLLEQDIDSLLAYQVLASDAKIEKTPIILQPEDIESLAAFRYVISHMAKPMQASLLGEQLYKQTVAAKEYLEKLLPPQRGV